MKKTIVLLIYPETPVTYWSFKYSLAFVKKEAILPPLGLITVAALLPENFECRLIDMNVTPLRDEDIQQADLVFLSAMIIQKASFGRVVERCRRLRVPVVAGGPYPTSSWKSIKGVDHFVLNEAEVTLPQFLSDFEKGRLKPLYQSTDKPDIAKSPAPRYDLLDMSKYEIMAVQYSRGCPFNCEFCDIIEMFGRRMRVKKTAQMRGELDMLYAIGWRGPVFIVDDNFIGHKTKVKEFLDTVIDWQKARNYPFTFCTEASINLADDEALLERFRAARFNMVFVGIETPSEKVLARAGKKQNLSHDLLKSVAVIQSYGIEVTGGFIVGFDSESPDIFDRQIEFIQRSGITTAMVGLLQAFPQTQLYRRLQKENRLLGDATGNNTHDMSVNFRTTMPEKDLIAGYKKILAAIYDPRRYFERSWVFLEHLKGQSWSSRQMTLTNAVYPLLRSMRTQGLSRYGFYYFRFLLKALIANPYMFPTAVSVAIAGHHLFKITREILAVDKLNRDIQLERRRFEKTAYMISRKYTFSGARRRLEIMKKKLCHKIERQYRKLHLDFQPMAAEAWAGLQRDLEHCLKGITRAYV